MKMNGPDKLETIGCNYRKGFTLAEAMLAAVLLAIAAAGVLLPFSSGAVVQAEGMHKTLAAKLASDLMEQIANTRFDQIVTNYDGFSETQGQVKNAAGVVFTDPAYENFARNAICQYVYVPQENGTVDPIFIRATVRVYYNGRQIVAMSRLITK
jgi:type II secretory pathway pseudopilin PulG